MNDASDDLTNSYPQLASDEAYVSEPTTNPVRDKSFTFALEVINLYSALTDQREYVISRQLLKSGTAISTIIEEAVSAESRRDFLHKSSMALK